MTQIEKNYLFPNCDHIRWLYQKYGALLLGYIAGIIPEQQESEKYLVLILSRFAVDREDDMLNEQVNWLSLLQYSRNLLAELGTQKGNRIAKSADSPRKQMDDGRLNMLSNREKEIFCSIYYHGKSIGDLAASMGESENIIRSQFKVSFDKIRSAGGN